MSDDSRLDETRRELIRLGYLSHRFERFLLQDALVAPGRSRGLLVLAAKIGLAAGALLATANALALAIANRLFETAPWELLILFLHVAVPVMVGTALGFLAVVGALRAILTALPRRGLDLARIGSALGAVGLVVGAGVWVGWDFLVGLSRYERVATVALLPVIAGGVAKLLADGLLAWEIRWTRHVPHERLVPRRLIASAVGTSATILAIAALLLPPAPLPAEPVALVVEGGAPVLVVGIDGVLPDELDYRIGQGELPTIERLSRSGGVIATYQRRPGLSPAEFWTTVATGRAGVEHGVVSLDGFEPLGMSAPLARTGPWRRYFGVVAEPLGLAVQRPLLSGRRRAPALWELVARGGRPVAAIDWWGTYPATALSGTVVAHGGWRLLGTETAGAVSPPALAERLGELRARTPPRLPDAPTLVGLPAPARALLSERALAPDAFYRAAASELAPAVGALALYLPATDLAASSVELGPERLAAIVRSELLAVDDLLDRIVPHFGAIAVVFDPGRRGGGEGRLLIWNDRCAASFRPAVDPREVAAALLRTAGLPQSRELMQPPGFCAWPEPPAEVPTYGARRGSRAAGSDGDDYLDALRSLGYL